MHDFTTANGGTEWTQTTNLQPNAGTFGGILGHHLTRSKYAIQIVVTPDKHTT
jgi:hypothetical protein